MRDRAVPQPICEQYAHEKRGYVVHHYGDYHLVLPSVHLQHTGYHGPSPTPYVAWGVQVEPEQPTPIPPETAAPQQTEAQQLITASGSLGVLTVGRKEIPIAGNVDEATLDKSPGWMPESALPGESGMCVILGHRNRKHLRPLEKVEIGDELIFTYPDGRTATYIVSETMIYESTADWRLPAVDGDTLVLVTCYPFRYSGSAPGKIMIVGILS